MVTGPVTEDRQSQGLVNGMDDSLARRPLVVRATLLSHYYSCPLAVGSPKGRASLRTVSLRVSARHVMRLPLSFWTTSFGPEI